MRCHNMALAALLAAGAVACEDQSPTTAPAEPTAAPAPDAIELAITAASNTWTKRAPMFQAWRGFAAGMVPNASGQPVMYTLGGDLGCQGTSCKQAGSTIFAYNAVTDTWTAKFAFNGIIGSRSNGAGRINDVLYVSGGFDLHQGYGFNHAWSLIGTIFRYNTATNALTRRASLPRGAADGVTGVIGGKLYILIGTAAKPGATCDEFTCPLAPFRSLYKYDPGANTVTQKHAAPHFHKNAAAGVINGKFYVAGGFDDKGNPTRTLDVYNPSTDSWVTKASLPATLSGLKGSVVQGKLYVVGTTATYAYNPATNSWAVRAPPPANTAAQAGSAAAVTATLDGKERMIVAGGNETSAGLRPTMLYTP
jgi:N-acetylneuraminic acid mutarotase